MTYKETLKKAEELEIDSLKLSVATNLNDVCNDFDKHFTDEQFEKVCDYICDCATSTDYATVWLICSAFVTSLNEDNIIEKALEKDYYDFTEWVTNNYNAWS